MTKEVFTCFGHVCYKQNMFVVLSHVCDRAYSIQYMFVDL